jgi:methionyl aminopeptidase
MAVVLRTRQQIAALREANLLVAATFDHLRPHVKPGVTTRTLDKLAEDFIRSKGAIPAYKGYGQHPFPATICVAPNNVICHGIPGDDRLREGDILGLDIGVLLKGWYGDSCVTLPIGAVDAQTQKLLDVTEEAMWRGIRAARPGNRLGDIGHAIQSYVEPNGFSVVREYTGHAVGQKLHEGLTILHYGKPNTGLRLQPGMVFTIEPMVNAGSAATVLDKRDKWTVRTADGSLSAQFEHSIAVSEDDPIVLSLA